MTISFDKILIACKSIAYLTLSVVLVLVFLEIRSFNQHLQKEITQVRIDTNAQLTATRESAISEVSGLRSDVRGISNKLDFRLASVETKTFKEIATIRTETLSRIDAIHKDLLPVRDSTVSLAKTYEGLPSQWEKRFGPYTDCEKNALCLQGQLSDTMFAVRTASRDIGSNSGVITRNISNMTTNIGLAANSFGQGFPKIVQNSVDVTENIKKMTAPKWYDRMFTYAVSGSLLYYNVRGASAIASSRK
jgi:hypothetical protein